VIQASPHPLLIALRNLRRGLASRLGLELYDRRKLEEEAKKLGKLDISDTADIIINYINAKKYPNKSTCRPNNTVKIRHKFPKYNLCLICIVFF
jgi:hypothetical protein